VLTYSIDSIAIQIDNMNPFLIFLSPTYYTTYIIQLRFSTLKVF